MKLNILFKTLFFIAVSSSIASGQTFTDINAALTNITNSSAQWVDYDNDGDLDVFINGYNDTPAYISELYQNNSGVFNFQTTGITGLANGDCAWGDYDGDGDMDLLIMGTTNNDVSGASSSIYRNDGASFTNINANLTAANNGSCKWGDIDNDGDLDAIISGECDSAYFNDYNMSTSSATRIYKNNNGEFEDINANIEGVCFSSVALGDVDNDNDLDLFVLGQNLNSNNNIAAIYINTNGSFEVSSQSITGLYNGNADFGDYDNDGDLDLAINGFDGGSVTNIYSNTNGTFTDLAAGLEAVQYGSIKWSDFNNDGYLDLISSGNNGTIDTTLVYINSGSGTFTHNTAGIPGFKNGSISLADYDKNGKQDILITGQSNDSVWSKIYSNNIATSNTAPSEPTNLSAQYTDTTVTLSWTKATDANQTDGLNYNIYIKNVDSTNYLVAPQANITSGYRKISKRGFINTTSYTIKNLKRGTYTWGIQAIDATFTSSTFTTSTFTKANTAPNAATNTYPANNATITTDTVHLYWQCSDYDNDALTYTVAFGEPGSMANIETNYAFDSLIVTGLLSGKTYNWQITANDGNSGTSTSEIFVFTKFSTDQEPNDDFATATNTNSTSSYEGSVGNSTDPADYYCFSSPSNCLLNIEIVNNNTVGLANGGLGNIDISEGANVFNTIMEYELDAGGTSSRLIQVKANTKYYIPIVPETVSDNVPYTLNLTVDNSFIPNDTVEVNNTIETAYPLYRTFITGDVGYWGDSEDWYALKFNGTGTFDISIHNPIGNNDIQSGLNYIYIYNSVGVEQPSISNPGDGSTYSSSPFTVSAGQIYYVKVFTWDQYSAADYTLTVNSTVLQTSTGWAPTVPISETFPNGSTELLPGSNTLTFSSSHPTGETVYYDLYLDNTNPPTTKVLPASTTGTYDITNVAWGDSVFWKAVAYTSIGDSAFSAVNQISSQQYGEINIENLPTIANSSVNWGDYDNDDDLDFFMAGYGNAKIYRNDGNNVFTDINAQLSNLHNCSADWGDYDNDGDLDLLFSGSSDGYDYNNYSTIYRNDAGIFTDINPGFHNIQLGSVAWGDYDNDGDLDILISGTDASIIYRNNGNETFTDINAGLVNIWSASADWGDYDNDGDLDILLTGSNNTIIYSNNNDNTFTAITTGLTAVEDGSGQWGDYDNDGDLDIVVTGHDNNIVGTANIYRNDAGVFTNINAGLVGVYNSSIAWGDCDNDGDLDLLITGTTNGETTGASSKIYINEGSNTFTDSNAGIANVFQSSVAWGDYDNNGSLDLFITGESDEYMSVSKIYKVNSLIKNTAPNSPTALVSAANGDDINLSWTAAIDTETPTSGLNYNVYIKNNDSTFYNTAISANSQNGYRTISKKGHINTTSYSISNLKRGTYSWGVQAIDASFVGSAFATGTFTKANNNPAQASLVYPTQGSTIDQTSIYLKWSANDPDGDALTYTVNFGLESSMSNIATDITADSVLVSDLLPSSNYEWQVITNDAYSGTSTSATFTFATVGSEQEPNNNIATATCSSESASFEASVGNTTDIADYYCFSYPVGCILTITITNTVNPEITNAGLNDVNITNGTDIVNTIQSYDLDAGDVASRTILVKANTKYYVPIVPTNLTVNVNYEIAFVVEEYNYTDNYEFNNTRENAYPIYTNTITSNVGFNNDTEDWYSFKTTTGGEFKLRVTNPSTIPNYQNGLGSVNVIDNLDNPQISLGDPGDGNSHESNLISVGANQTYYIQVHPGDQFSACDYTFELLTTTQEIKETMAPTVPHSEIYPMWSNDLPAGDSKIYFPSTHPTGETIFYDFYFGDTEPPNLVGEGLTSGEFDLTGIEWDNAYYWKAVAYTANGDSAASQVFGLWCRRFSEQWQLYLPHLYESDVEWGDYDNDGDLDFIISGSGDYHDDAIYGNTSYYSNIYNNDNGQFSNIQAGLLPLTNGSVDWADIDNDGDLDAMITGYEYQFGSRIATIYRNNNGTFTDIGAMLPGVDASDTEFADFDNDGDLDLLITGTIDGNYSGAITNIYRNDQGTFNHQESLEGIYQSSVDCGDFDNDGDIDILLSGKDATNNTESTKIYKNENGSFSEFTTTLPNIFNGEAKWGDADNDGDLDILISGSGYDSQAGDNKRTKVYLYDNNTYTALDNYIEPMESATVDWGDVNNDGFIDILMSGTPNWGDNAGIQVYVNKTGDGNGVSFEYLTWTHSIYDGSIEWGDFDNDNDLDILISGRDNNGDPSTVIAKNNLPAKNTPPVFNGSLKTKVTENGLELNWDRASDAETSAKGLSYNVYVKGPENSGSPALADLESGYRLIAERGLVQDTTYTIDTTGFAYGEYTCMVQAIDASFAGSNWSSKRTFTLSSNPAPYINLLSPANNALDADTVGLQLSWSASDPTNEPLTYNLYFGTTNPPLLLADNLQESDSVYALAALNGNTKYYWFVEVLDSINISTSEVRNFETYFNNAPTVSLISPANELSPAPTTITLEWSVTDQEKDSVKSYLYWGTTSETSNMINVTDTNKYTLSGLQYEVEYFWKIRAVDSIGAETISPVWSFTCGEDLPPVLSLSYPENNAININVHPITFTWSASDDGGVNAIKYDLFFDTNNPPTTQRLDSVAATSFYFDTLISEQNFYWQVIAYDATGNSNKSAVYHFTSVIENHNFFKIVVTEPNNTPVKDAAFIIDFGDNDTTGFTNTNGESAEYYTHSSNANIQVINQGSFGYTESNINIPSNQKTTQPVNLPPLADYNGDGNLNVTDLSQLIDYWNADDVTYEMAPVTGNVPYYTVDPDGILDFNDLMIFVMMWENQNKKKSGTPTFKYVDTEDQNNDFTVTYTEDLVLKDNVVTYNFKLLGNESLSANCLKISYDNSQLTYLNHKLLLSDSYKEISLIDHREEHGYFEINTGILENNLIDNENKLLSITFDIIGNSSNVPKATYETYSSKQTISKGVAKFLNQTTAISVYPNPANDKIQINMGRLIGTANFTITDVTGRTLLQKEILNSSEKVDIHELPSGILMIQVKMDNSIYNTKIVKN
jgi:hypothetical protein